MTGALAPQAVIISIWLGAQSSGSTFLTFLASQSPFPSIPSTALQQLCADSPSPKATTAPAMTKHPLPPWVGMAPADASLLPEPFGGYNLRVMEKEASLRKMEKAKLCLVLGGVKGFFWLRFTN